MNSDLVETAFCGVYSSSREIIKNKQKHLYCNMLDLLSSTCKATAGCPASRISKDDQVHFWCNEVLPLATENAAENDMAIQRSSLSALELGLLKLDIEYVHSSVHWPSIKQTIVTLHAPRIHKLLERKSPLWHLVWCVLIRLLDSEILKSATIINAFLAIVEMGFRSPEIQIRIEAFTCWRLLIKIFTAHGDIYTSKRLRLLSIPLKASQTKSAEAALVKLRVWWYLLTCLGSRACEEFDMIVGNFLTFAIGARTRKDQGAAQQYEVVRELVLPCLTTLLTVSAATPVQTANTLERMLREHNLEPFTSNSPLADFAGLGNHRQRIVDATLEAIHLLVQRDSLGEGEHFMLEQLLSFLMKPVLCLEEPKFATQICRELTQLLPQYPRPVVFAIGAIAMDGLKWCNASKVAEDYADVLQALLHMISAAKAVVPPDILQRCIEHVFALNLFGTGRNQWRALAIVLELIGKQPVNTPAAGVYDTRLLVWMNVSGCVLEYLQDNGLDCRLKEYAQVLNSWILWPLSGYAAHARAAAVRAFDVKLFAIWRRLLIASRNSPERTTFIGEMRLKLQAFLPLSSAEATYHAELLHSYADEVLKLEGGKDMQPHRDLLALLQEVVVPTTTAKAMEIHLNVLRAFVVTLKDDELFTLSESIKAALSHTVTIAQKSSLDKAIYKAWKTAITERLRAHSNKSYGTQLCDILKSANGPAKCDSDGFVVIPAVWSLDPAKLTDRQKERFSERSMIPALYNDMSRSQESSSLKPWTPRKIIVKNTDCSEIAIECVEQPQEKPTSSTPSEKVMEPINVTPTGNSELASAKRESRRLRFALRSHRKLLVDDTITISDSENEAHAISENRPASAGLANDAKPLEDGSYLDMEPLATSCSTRTSVDVIETIDSVASSEEPLPLEAAVAEISTGNLQCPEVTPDLPKDDQQLAKEHSAFNTTAEILMEQRMASPKRNLVKYTQLTSPPDRKLTNNTTSPTLRPKPSAHLTGRGAQLINMIRNRSKTDFAATPQSSTPLAQCNVQEAPESSLEPEHTSTPVAHRELLVFSRTLPSLRASPSTSILKRKTRSDSIEDTVMESPALKRKRVSFHDPPVSLTKEYLRDADEMRSLKRCLNMDRAAMEAKHLKRQSKLESMAQIENFTAGVADKFPEIATADDVECRKSEPEPTLATPLPHDLTQVSSEILLDFVVEHHSVQTLLDKYFAKESSAVQKLTSTLANYMSNCMASDQRAKAIVLETLSENHAKDFLDHAIQENLSTVVCDRLNLASVIDYLCAKAKINANCRSGLFAQLPDVFSQCKPGEGSSKCLHPLLQCTDLADDAILDLIALLVRKRTTSAAESAADSSSNL